MNIQDLRTRRVGLVLSGGGAKGAYQVGCWKALRAFGVDRFDAIAGSSVGAINAVFVATGRLDLAEDAWRNLSARDVISIRAKEAWRLPMWLVAALGSEFSPFKITRLSDRVGTSAAGWTHAAVCAALSAAIWFTRGLLPSAWTSWAAFAAAAPLALAALTRAHRLTRPVFLRPVFTDNTPLRQTLTRVLSEDHVRELRNAGRPVYGVLSQHVPGAAGSHRWSGWAPRYIRLDRFDDAASLCRTLADGSAVPGFLRGGSLDGRPILDGAWTDNVPTGPLLFGDHDLDAIIVIYLKQIVRHTHRHNSLCAVLRLLILDALGRRPAADLRGWARARWMTYRASCNGPDVPPAAAVDTAGRQPVVISVAPSRRIGNFFTGTLWFSRAKSASLIELGERDMREALERLSALPVAATPAITGGRDRSRGRPAAVPQPAPASLGRSIVRALWPWPERTAAE